MKFVFVFGALFALFIRLNCAALVAREANSLELSHDRANFRTITRRLRIDTLNASEERNIFNFWRRKKHANWEGLLNVDDVPQFTPRQIQENIKWSKKDLKEVLTALNFRKVTSPEVTRQKMFQLDEYLDSLDLKTEVKTMDEIVAKRLKVLGMLKGNDWEHTKELKRHLAHVWVIKRIPVRNVYRGLKMNEEESLENLFSIRSGEETLDFFLDFFYATRKYHNDKEELAELFLETYDVATVLHLINVGSRLDSAQVFVAQLEHSLHRKWSSMSHNKVFFDILHLDKKGSQVFNTFEMQTWYRFIKGTDPDEAEAKTLIFLIHSYGTAFLSDVLIRGQGQSISSLRPIFRKALLDHWAKQKTGS